VFLCRSCAVKKASSVLLIASELTIGIVATWQTCKSSHTITVWIVALSKWLFRKLELMYIS
jgi:hypothetical protein